MKPHARHARLYRTPGGAGQSAYQITCLWEERCRNNSRDYKLHLSHRGSGSCHPCKPHIWRMPHRHMSGR
eukprot:9500788-Pyramimonas_sp.AAC.1